MNSNIGSTLSGVNAHRTSRIHTPRSHSMSAWKHTGYSVRPFRQSYFSRICGLTVLQHSSDRFYLHHNAEYLAFPRCSFGRRGQPASAVRSEAEVRRLMALCKVLRECTRVRICQRACGPVPKGRAVAVITALHSLPPQRTGRRHFGTQTSGSAGEHLSQYSLVK